MTNFPQEIDPQMTAHSSSNDYLTAGPSDVTMGGEPMESLSFAGQPDPLRQAREVVPQIENESVAKQTERLLSFIHKYIQLVQKAKPDLSRIPPMYGYIDEDGSMLLEWMFPDFRVGFNIEPNPEDSGWHLISNKKLGESTASGHLAKMSETIDWLLKFIVSNT